MEHARFDGRSVWVLIALQRLIDASRTKVKGDEVDVALAEMIRG
jgi:hypothetical protein